MSASSSPPLSARERQALEMCSTTTLAGVQVPLPELVEVLQRTPRGRQVLRRELYARRRADTGRKVQQHPPVTASPNYLNV